jgi:DNA-binding response OmpR family regulator
MMLTASQSEADHVAGLELGADDFVIKPLEPRVPLARIRTQLRRLAGAPSVEPSRERGRIEIGALRVDGLARSVSVAECPVALTTMEFDILLRLATHAGSVVERDVLYKETIGAEYDGLDRGLDVHVSRIRRKLERAGFDPSRLKSVRGVGYLLAPR